MLCSVPVLQMLTPLKGNSLGHLNILILHGVVITLVEQNKNNLRF
jgi:hypothetical protein